ncbi:DUF445 domain-containing protein [Acidiferrimicrobium sp. IK]|uniref:DUF445 domain-containing protein n=1 Tax=Acidiferrimicrobium sp. IK TaxID=2871700 RepID=UPI0021CAEB7B|nr:DUF445 domain-containing protein [Acidiferrimicrobium sp. IK]MCU4183015.1 DUF445 domain-containing protein [Acidiferrimicrobium sp. IK]
MQTPAAWRALSGAENEDAGPLRRMKRTATAALVVAAAVFVATYMVHGGSHGVLAFVRAGAEAAMVGGLADWFAVTALFRRPLGLPIPHTALIPRKKDELATKLGEFVTGYFLTPEALQRQVTDTDLVNRVGAWLADPAHAEPLARDVAVAAERALVALDAADIVDYAVHLVRRHQAGRSWAPMLGRLLETATEGGAERPFVDVLAARGRDYLRAHLDELRPTVRRFIEDRNWVTWLVTTDRFVTRLLRDAATELDAIATEPEHPLRVALEGLLLDVADDLQHDSVLATRIDETAGKVLADDRFRGVMHDLVGAGLQSVRDSLAPDGELTARIAGLIGRLGRRAVDDPRTHSDVERWASDMIGHAVTRYGGELTQLIRRQVGDWPAAAASRRIELAVGRDLQYIRINGTVVGALAGIVIHALSLLLPS